MQGMEIRDKIAIVTGASAGIGLATARLLTEQGVKVALVSRSRQKLEELSHQLPESVPIVTDVSKPEEIIEMVAHVKKHYGRIDILVNVAGQGYDAPIEATDLNTFHKVFDLDVVGPLVAMQQVIPMMKEQHAGAIVNISSGTALMVLPNTGAYSSLKRALAQLSLTAQEELKPFNIQVSVIYPYMTDTDFEKNTIKHGIIQEQEEEGDGPPFPPDPAELVAQKIMEAIITGQAEVYAHDWMKP